MLREFWNDERGSVVSAEAVVVGSAAVGGALVGIGTVSESVNDEMHDVAHSFRSLNQSYMIHGFTGATAWTPGSYFIQEDVALSRARLDAYRDEIRRRYSGQEAERSEDEVAPPPPGEEPSPENGRG